MQRDLPTGTVTFLFTDVEGSTRLLEELGSEGYAEALGRHREVIRDALAAHDGVEVDTQGDAFFCAFASARSAVACAGDVRSGLAATPIRVRMGIHTGEALVAGDHYVGLDVHRAARIGACGHGGQVVVSPSTVALLEPGSFPLRDLGEHRLKDLSAPVRLHQLGDEEFGPLKTLFRTNLPVPATEFLGREEELRELAARAAAPGVRLLTLTGPGGTGKTRLALQLAAELADRFPDGVFWAPLAALRDEGLVGSAVAQALEVEERPDESLLEAIPRSVGERRLLFLLDNCEHVLDAAARVAAPILARCPSVLLLATSRQPLGVTGEHVYPVQPLLTTDATSLFEARARAAGATVDSPESQAAIQRLCMRLDNLPLAVELAAARTAVLPPVALLERLSSRLGVLAGPRDAEERQRTLQATIAWSYELLTPAEQTLFRRLAVFNSGAALDAVEEVCEADLEELFSLVAKSLVRHMEVPGGEPRYWMLETIREFAAAALETAGEREAFRDRHLEWFAALAREARDWLARPGSEWYDRLERDLANLRAAFAHAVERADPAAIDVAIALAPVHLLHGRSAEAEDTNRKALALEPEAWDEQLLRRRLARVLRQRGRWSDALEEHESAGRLLEGMEHRDERWWEAWIYAKIGLANHHYFRGDIERLGALVEELGPQVERHGTPLQEVDFLHLLGQHAYRRERYVLSDETEALMREIHARSLALGDESADFTLGFALLWRGKFAEAVEALQEGLASARRRGDALFETRCLAYQAVASRRLGDVERVRALLAELGELEDVHGYEGLVQANVAWVAYRDGDLDDAAAAAERAIADWEAGERAGPGVFQWTARFPMIGVELGRGRPDEALEHARVLLDPDQQPLPPELGALVERAVADRDTAPLERALAAAREIGYA